MQVPVNATLITAAAKRYVAEVMESGWISSAGPVVAQFERRWADYLGVKHAITTGSGTTALHLALVALGIGPGDEVIVPDFTMIGTVYAVLYTGAEPVFVDCEPDIFTIDPAQLAQAITQRTKAIMPVHIYGHSANMDPIIELAGRHGLHVIEDAAEAHGAKYKSRYCGAIGHIGCFSFYGNKIITTGEGGMVVTDDDHLAQRARHLRDMAHIPGHRFLHGELGFSYRMPSLSAACGLGQLEEIDRLLQKKKWIATTYSERLSNINGLHLPVTRDWADNVHWMYAVLLDDKLGLTRDEFAQALKARGVDTRDFFQSSAEQPLVRATDPNIRGCPISASIAKQGLLLPSGLGMTPEQIDYVCTAIHDVAQQ